MPSGERRQFLADFARKMRELPDGAKIDIKWTK